MGKRKQCSDLRVIPTDLQIGKIKHPSELWNIIKLQPFFPPIESLFKINTNSLGIKLPETILSLK